MNAKKFSIFLAAFALVIAQLACAFGEPTLSNVRTAKDQDGKQPAAVFGTSDTIYVVADLSNGAKGNTVSSKWFVDNVPGYDPNYLIDQADVNVDQDNFNGNIYFYFEPPSGGWPTGTYKVEVYFNGNIVNTVPFSVQ